ncbi:MAG: hypothetical protein LWX51_01755 [Deltaproteobacteria bacterium]|nr:hypothetical protein [Deltaproteobacteria bacterium]
MDKKFERIKEILGKDCKRSSQNAIRYLTYLKKNSKNTLPSNWHRGLPMGRTICNWRMG